MPAPNASASLAASRAAALSAATLDVMRQKKMAEGTGL